MKKSANTASNGVGGGVVGRGGVAACVGAFLLQSAHPSLMLRISVDMPGQKTMALARCSIIDVPW